MKRWFARPHATLTLIWLLVGAIPLPVREVMPPDESRFTHQAQNMRETGEWIVPKIGDVPNADKPPVIFWLANLFSLGAERVTASGSRVQSALGALLAAFLTLRLGRRLFGSESLGLLGAAILLTTAEFSQKTQWMSCDMPLVAFSFAALTLWREALFEDAPAARWRILAGWLLAAAGTLTKGPLGLLWPLWWVLSEAAARGRFRPLVRLLFPAGPLLYALPVFGWLRAFRLGSSAASFNEALFTQTLTRYTSSWNNVQPFYFFAAQTPMDLFPWALFLPAAAVLAWHGWRDRQDETRVAVRAALIFIGIALVFFSISPGKRGVYLLPAFPPLALLLARVFEGPHTQRLADGWRRIPLHVLAVVGVLLGAALPLAIAAGALPKAAQLAERAGWLWLPALVVAGLALAWGALAARREPLRLALALAVGLCALGTLGGAAWSRYQNGEPFGRRVAAVVPQDARLLVERGKFEMVLYYAQRRGTEFETDEQLLRYAREGGPFAPRGSAQYAVVEEPTYERLKDAPPLAGVPVVLRERVSRTTYVIAGPL